jgi:tetratricopeptide (TPR) repeat protein
LISGLKLLDNAILEKLVVEVAKQLKSEKDNLEDAIDIALGFSKTNSIPPECLIEISAYFALNSNYLFSYVFSNVASSISTGKILAVACSNAGLALSKIGRLDDAEEQYKLALASDPNHVTIHSNYGNLLQERGRLDEAEEQYKLALALDPNDVNTHSHYGFLLQERGRLDEAEEQYKLALASDPNHPTTHLVYALLLCNTNKQKKALKEIKIASHLFIEKGNNEMEHLSMALLYEEFTNKYYKLGSERKKETNSSGGNFRKSGHYAQLTGDEYINASKYAKENSRKLYLTMGFTLMGRAKVRKLELSLWEDFILRMQNLKRYDITNFKRIMLGVKNASICYKKAAEYSPENNTQCNACSDCMSILESTLNYMITVTHQKTVSKPEDKIKEWNGKLSYAESIYKGGNGEIFVQSLRKFIACIENLEKYKRTTSFESKELLNECMNELRNVASNIEGPLQEIIECSVQKMELCKRKHLSITGGTEIEPIEYRTNFDRILDAGKWMIEKPIRFVESIIFTVLIAIIATKIIDYFQNV